PTALVSNDGIYSSPDTTRILILNTSNSVMALDAKDVEVTDVSWGAGLSFTATFLYPKNGIVIRSSFKFLKLGVLSETFVATGLGGYSRSGTNTWRNVLLP